MQQGKRKKEMVQANKVVKLKLKMTLAAKYVEKQVRISQIIKSISQKATVTLHYVQQRKLLASIPSNQGDFTDVKHVNKNFSLLTPMNFISEIDMLILLKRCMIIGLNIFIRKLLMVPVMLKQPLKVYQHICWKMSQTLETLKVQLYPLLNRFQKRQQKRQ